MRLRDIENEIKRREEIDNKDPEIFNLLRKMIYLYLIRYKIATHADSENISLLMAEDMFMKIYNGSIIYAPIRYVARCRNGYIRIHRKMTDTQIIDTAEDYDLYKGIVNMSTSGSSKSNEQYNNICVKESLSSIPNIIKEVINKSSRYHEYSSSNMNIYLSILLSINNNYETCIFLDESEYQYFLLLLNKVKNEINKHIIENISDDLDNSRNFMEAFLED